MVYSIFSIYQKNLSDFQPYSNIGADIQTDTDINS